MSEVSYSFKASSFGAPWEFKLQPAGIEWSVGKRAGLLRYDGIRRVRLSFRPVTMQNHRFQTEIWSSDMPKITIASTSWRGMFEQTRQDDAYGAFIIEMHRGMAAAGSRAQFVAGMPSFVYWAGLAIFVTVSIGLAALAVRSMRPGEWAGAGFIGGFLVLFMWQIGNYFRRNRPGGYRPEDVPLAVLPRR